MKRSIIIIACLISFSALGQKKKDFGGKRQNVFLTAEFVRKTGASLFYNHKLKESRFGFGGGLQVDNFKVKNSISPMLDARYFLPVERSAFIPNIQIGKNFSRFDVVNPPIQGAQGRGGFQVNANLGFSLGIFKNHDGPYASVGYRFTQYRYFAGKDIYDKKNFKDFILSVGVRF